MLNKVQEKSYKLIQADARFVYTLTRVLKSPNAPKSNYIMMLYWWRRSHYTTERMLQTVSVTYTDTGISLNAIATRII